MKNKSINQIKSLFKKQKVELSDNMADVVILCKNTSEALDVEVKLDELMIANAYVEVA